MRLMTVAVGLSLLGFGPCPPARAETISLVSIGCDTIAATLMAETALRDSLSGKDRDAMNRITAYRDKTGQHACRPLDQGELVSIVRDQDDMACVRAIDERATGPDAPACYWVRRRHIKHNG
jgi:hypothetical protein